MKKESSVSKKPVCIIDSEKAILGMSHEELEKIKNSPQIRAIDELYERLRNGTATEDERIDHEIRIAEREMDANRFRS
ncbi:hypothetical protein JIN84_05955 [Luteolibacter yonseiensis]|uniref:Uncharacterized protein n=1 Tax=Luteolibacter yonseiensis TaxID=1144680 RepID=A0A934R2L8_9BACT|nr:hypothetical protein [Luteolibacter yonseiensis]MBK1815146.1 hypothetical protein [Luteolibacter yonseiensis]